MWLTTVPQHFYGKQAVRDWMMAPRGVPAQVHLEHQRRMKNHVNSRYSLMSHCTKKQFTTLYVCNLKKHAYINWNMYYLYLIKEIQLTTGGLNLLNTTNMTCTFHSKTCIVTRISVKSSKSPHACQNKRPLEWQASTVCVTSACLRQKDGLSGAGGRPKMTWHWSQRYCLCGFFTQRHISSVLQRQPGGAKCGGERFENGETLHVSREEATGRGLALVHVSTLWQTRK